MRTVSLFTTHLILDGNLLVYIINCVGKSAVRLPIIPFITEHPFLVQNRMSKAIKPWKWLYCEVFSLGRSWSMSSDLWSSERGVRSLPRPAPECRVGSTARVPGGVKRGWGVFTHPPNRGPCQLSNGTLYLGCAVNIRSKYGKRSLQRSWGEWRGAAYIVPSPCAVKVKSSPRTS